MVDSRTVTKQQVRAIMAGDIAAWRAFVKAHIRRVSGYLGSWIPDLNIVRDLTIRTFAAAYEARSALPAAGEDTNAWLRRFAATIARDWAAETGTRQRMKLDFPAELCADDPALYRRLNHLHKAIHALPDQHRKPLEYAYRAGMNGPALAKALRCEQADLQEHLSKAVSALKAQLAHTSS